MAVFTGLDTAIFYLILWFFGDWHLIFHYARSGTGFPVLHACTVDLPGNNSTQSRHFILKWIILKSY